MMMFPVSLIRAGFSSKKSEQFGGINGWIHDGDVGETIRPQGFGGIIRPNREVEPIPFSSVRHKRRIVPA
jgi:hypothetical protein